jgi:hypothetical protein
VQIHAMINPFHIGINILQHSSGSPLKIRTSLLWKRFCQT